MERVEITSVAQLREYVGKEINVGPWIEVTQQMVDAFAEATGDRYFIHTDPERASKSLFQGTVAHGYFTLSMLAGFLVENLEGLQLDLPPGTNVNYGMNKARFVSPVPVGRKIRVRIKLKAIEEDPDAKWLQIAREQSVEIDGMSKPALVAETVSRRYFS